MTNADPVVTRSSKASAPTAAEVPVPRAMLGKVRTEVLQRIDQAREEAKADAQRLDAKIDQAREEAKADAQRLDAKIDAVKAELKADIHGVKAELKADIQGVKAEIHEVKAEIHEVKAGMHAMQAHVARIELLVEEQNARNRIVLDAIAALLSRQNQVEQRVVQVEDTVRMLASAQPSR